MFSRSRTPRLAGRSCKSATSATAATRARVDQPSAATSRLAIRNSEQRLPYIGGSVLDAGRHVGPGVLEIGSDLTGPLGELVSQQVTLGSMHAVTERLDAFAWCPAPHPVDDRVREDRVPEIVKPGERDGAVCRQPLRLDDLAADNASASGRSMPVAGVEHSPDVLVVFGLGPEHGVDLAQGVLAERSQITPDEAFAWMRAHARRTSQRLNLVATKILDGTLQTLAPPRV